MIIWWKLYNGNNHFRCHSADFLNAFDMKLFFTPFNIFCCHLILFNEGGKETKFINYYDLFQMVMEYCLGSASDIIEGWYYK